MRDYLKVWAIKSKYVARSRLRDQYKKIITKIPYAKMPELRPPYPQGWGGGDRALNRPDYLPDYSPDYSRIIPGLLTGFLGRIFGNQLRVEISKLTWSWELILSGSFFWNGAFCFLVLSRPRFYFFFVFFTSFYVFKLIQY